MMKNNKKWMYISAILLFSFAIFVIFNSRNSTDEPWVQLEHSLQSEFEIEPPLQTHVELEDINMWLVGFFPVENPVGMYFRLQNISDYTIILDGSATLEVYYSGHWRIAPSNISRSSGIPAYGRIDERTFIHPSSIQVIRIAKADYCLIPGLYRLRVPITTAIRQDSSDTNDLGHFFRIQHDVVAEFHFTQSDHGF